MIDYNPNEPLISIHIPKCGGTSLRQILNNWFRPNFRAQYARGGKMDEVPILETHHSDGSPIAGLCVKFAT